MAFKQDDLIIDRIQYGYAEDFDGNPLYALTQLSEATIEITAESVDATDKDGTLIKRFWRGKTGTFTATNAMLNLNVVGAASGSGKVEATSSASIAMPKLVTVAAGKTLDISGYQTGTVKVNALGTNGALGKAYTLGTAASENEFAVSNSGVLTPPTDANETQFLVRYERDVTNGVAIHNKADKFPGTVRLILKALCVDPCSADTLRACYIVLHSFQVSPEITITLSSDGTLDYTGDLQVDYCSADKALYSIYVAADDEEEDD